MSAAKGHAVLSPHSPSSASAEAAPCRQRERTSSSDVTYQIPLSPSSACSSSESSPRHSTKPESTRLSSNSNHSSASESRNDASSTTAGVLTSTSQTTVIVKFPFKAMAWEKVNRQAMMVEGRKWGVRLVRPAVGSRQPGGIPRGQQGLEFVAPEEAWPYIEHIASIFDFPTQRVDPPPEEYPKEPVASPSIPREISPELLLCSPLPSPSFSPSPPPTPHSPSAPTIHLKYNPTTNDFRSALASVPALQSSAMFGSQSSSTPNRAGQPVSHRQAQHTFPPFPNQAPKPDSSTNPGNSDTTTNAMPGDFPAPASLTRKKQRTHVSIAQLSVDWEDKGARESSGAACTVDEVVNTQLQLDLVKTDDGIEGWDLGGHTTVYQRFGTRSALHHIETGLEPGSTLVRDVLGEGIIALDPVWNYEPEGAPTIFRPSQTGSTQEVEIRAGKLPTGGWKWKSGQRKLEKERLDGSVGPLLVEDPGLQIPYKGRYMIFKPEGEKPLPTAKILGTFTGKRTPGQLPFPPSLKLSSSTALIHRSATILPFKSNHNEFIFAVTHEIKVQDLLTDSSSSLALHARLGRDDILRAQNIISTPLPLPPSTFVVETHDLPLKELGFWRKLSILLRLRSPPQGPFRCKSPRTTFTPDEHLIVSSNSPQPSPGPSSCIETADHRRERLPEISKEGSSTEEGEGEMNKFGGIEEEGLGTDADEGGAIGGIGKKKGKGKGAMIVGADEILI